MPLTADETRAARRLLGQGSACLATMSGVPFGAIMALEETGLVREVIEHRIRRTLQEAGIELQRSSGDVGPSVRLRP